MFRSNTWWPANITPIVGWLYFACAVSHHSQQIFFSAFTIQLFCSAVLVAAWGYISNDFFDFESDLASGKKNSLSNIPILLRYILLLVTPFIALYVFPSTTRPLSIASVLLLLQIMLLFIYSAPPVRLKTRGIYGIIADALYGHVLPVFIVLTAGGVFTSQTTDLATMALLVVILITTSLKGVRNILLHQLQDRKMDKQQSVQTFVSTQQPLGILRFINKLVPIEISFATLLVLLLFFYFPPILIVYIVFMAFYYLRFSGWKLSYLPKRQLQVKFLYFMNDFFESWLPLTLLIFLCREMNGAWWLVPIHLLLFPGFSVQLLRGLKEIRLNLKTENDY